jgi:hypothetical protein
MTTFDVEVVLKGRDYAVTESLAVPHGAPTTWDEGAVRDVLVAVLRAIDRAQNPEQASERAVMLTGFSWIVEPMDGQVVLAIEIPMGAAVAGPFDVPAEMLDTLVRRAIQVSRHGATATVVH